jgi:transketolase
MSDGECEEGSTWEAALFAAHHKLDNLVGIVDYNKLQAFGRIKDVLNLEPLVKKWKSFGGEVKEIDGHNFSQIERAFSRIPFKKGKPSLVIAHTIKGKGVSFIENKMEWHYKNLTKEQYELALKELE